MLLRNEGFMEFWRLLKYYTVKYYLKISHFTTQDVTEGTELYPAELLNTILVVAWNILSKSGANIFILFI